MTALPDDFLQRSDWYHTVELPGGLVTPGFFDHRSVLDRYPFPEDMSGRRVLDVGAADGFFSFEMARRGAEVVALDAPDRSKLDFPAPLRRQVEGERFKTLIDNFETLRDLLGARVERRLVSVYDISPDELGMFDTVFVGSILIHLRDPVGALTRVASVTRDELLVVDEVDRRLDRSKRPMARLQAISPHLTWWIPNRACLADMVEAAGFVDVEQLDRFVVPYGRGGKGGVLHASLRARSHPG